MKAGSTADFWVFYGCAMCELRHPSISTSRRRSGIQIPFIGVGKLLSRFKYGPVVSAVSIDEAALISLRIKV